MDLVVSCRGGHKCLMALTERVTRQEIMRLIRTKSAASVVRAMNTGWNMGKCSRKYSRPLPWDNGTEFFRLRGHGNLRI